jgi:integrase
MIFSMALGTGLRLGELVGLNVGDVFTPDGTPRVRVRIRPEIAKGGRAADVLLPDRLVVKLRRFWRWKRERGEGLEPGDSLFANQTLGAERTPLRSLYTFISFGKRIVAWRSYVRREAICSLNGGRSCETTSHTTSTSTRK